jgi:rsbT co-antagonist protein RsbR
MTTGSGVNPHAHPSQADSSFSLPRHPEHLLLTQLIETTGDGIALTDRAGRLIYSNAAYQTLTGYGVATNSKTLADLHPDDAAHGGIPLNDVVQQGIWRGQVTTRRADGTTFPAEIALRLLTDQNDEPSAIGIIMRDISAQLQHKAEVSIFKTLVENAPDAIGVAETTGTILYANPAYRAMFGGGKDVTGMSGFDFIVEEDRTMVSAVLARLPSERIGHVTARARRAGGGTFPVAISIFLQETPDGAQQVIGFLRDLTEQQRTETERAALQQQVIDAQQAALRELSTPLIPLADGVVAMPLIGSIDSSRAQLVIETLLTGVAEMRAHTTLIDITGVPVVDTQVANGLLRAAQAIRLLGAHVILTGIRPEVAQTLVGLGIDLSGVSTRGTLQSGIVEALGQVAERSTGRRS